MDISTKRLLGGKYFISMGTAMIFESSEFDIRKWPNLMYLNLRTLYRNYVASIPTDYQKHVKVKDMLEDFFKEVSTVETIIKEVSQNRVKILFYYPSLRMLCERHQFGLADIRLHNVLKYILHYERKH